MRHRLISSIWSRALLVALALIVLAARPALSGHAHETEIQDAIVRQLEAFRRGDGPAAFAVASPKIQELFGNPATFMETVQRSYPEIFRSRSHRFLNLSDDDGRIEQRVLILGGDASVIARYEMVEVDGQWRINGVWIDQQQEI